MENRMKNRKRKFFIAVHVGAGYHSERKNGAYKEAMRTACERAAALLSEGRAAEQAVVEAIKSLETSQVCNAGFGSNLTETGVVECDAAVMAGDGVFGGIGAVAGVAHPIEAAYCLAMESREPMPLGRVRPIFLCGDGARQYALSRGLLAASTSEEARHWNIAWSSLIAWNRFRVLVDDAAKSQEYYGHRHAPAPPSAIHAHGHAQPQRLAYPYAAPHRHTSAPARHTHHNYFQTARENAARKYQDPRLQQPPQMDGGDGGEGGFGPGAPPSMPQGAYSYVSPPYGAAPQRHVPPGMRSWYDVHSAKDKVALAAGADHVQGWCPAAQEQAAIEQSREWYKHAMQHVWWHRLYNGTQPQMLQIPTAYGWRQHPQMCEHPGVYQAALQLAPQPPSMMHAPGHGAPGSYGQQWAQSMPQWRQPAPHEQHGAKPPSDSMNEHGTQSAEADGVYTTSTSDGDTEVGEEVESRRHKRMRTSAWPMPRPGMHPRTPTFGAHHFGAGAAQANDMEIHTDGAADAFYGDMQGTQLDGIPAHAGMMPDAHMPYPPWPVYPGSGALMHPQWDGAYATVPHLGRPGGHPRGPPVDMPPKQQRKRGRSSDARAGVPSPSRPPQRQPDSAAPPGQLPGARAGKHRAKGASRKLPPAWPACVGNDRPPGVPPTALPIGAGKGVGDPSRLAAAPSHRGDFSGRGVVQPYNTYVQRLPVAQDPAQMRAPEHPALGGADFRGGERHGAPRLRGAGEPQPKAELRNKESRNGDGADDPAGPQPTHASRQQDTSAPSKNSQQKMSDEEVFDTVGAIVVDCDGRVAAGVSSGGIAMKMDGRVGDSAVFGCGVWAEDPTDGGEQGVATTTTGVGENIMRTLLAKRCADAIKEESKSSPMDKVISDGIMDGVKVCPPPHDVGVLAVLVNKSSEGVNVNMAVVHTAVSMGVGYYAQDGDKCDSDVQMLRQIHRLHCSNGRKADPSSTDGDSGLCVYGVNTGWSCSDGQQQ